MASEDAKNDAVGSGDEPLPVRAVTLFTSGVAYTLREGEVDGGEASVALTFRTAQVNDLLKSLVLLDDGGSVRPASYPSRDPIGRALQSFAVDVTQNRSRAEMLRSLRGTPVRVETVASEVLEGAVVGVEERQEGIADGRYVTVETLTLLTGDGLTAVDLPRVRLLRLLDPRLDRELRDALAVLATGSDDARRTVTLGFEGENRRSVRVGYVTEAPLWKVSYRLVLGEEAEGDAAGKAYLQGWALVENTSDDDWNGIALSLVSGRPISFIQDLYQPLYVPRPVVEPDIIASPFPQTHGGDLAAAQPPPAGAMPSAPPAYAAMAEEALMLRSAAALPRATLEKGFAYSSEMRDSVESQAEGESVGELFAYHIDTPVTLARQQAAMIPILSDDVEGEKLSLFNADEDPRFPMNAVRLNNSTALHLKGGPVTLFDGGLYAGDARMEDVPPGDARLITYAVDLTVEGERQVKTPDAMQVVSLSLRGGALQIKRLRRRQTEYTLKSKAQKPRLVYVEHPVAPDWTLVEPEAPAERSAQHYRFAVRLAPGETRTLAVTTEQPVAESVALFDGSFNLLLHHNTSGLVPAALKEAVAATLELRRRIQELREQEQARGTEGKAIHEEQGRIRQNMAALDKDSALYRRYVTELDSQETRLKTLRDEAETLRDQARDAERELRAYIDSLEIDG